MRTCVKNGIEIFDRCNLYAVDNNGKLTSRMCSDKNGIRACVNLNNNIAVSNRKNDEGYYLLFII